MYLYFTILSKYLRLTEVNAPRKHILNNISSFCHANNRGAQLGYLLECSSVMQLQCDSVNVSSNVAAWILYIHHGGFKIPLSH